MLRRERDVPDRSIQKLLGVLIVLSSSAACVFGIRLKRLDGRAERSVRGIPHALDIDRAVPMLFDPGEHIVSEVGHDLREPQKNIIDPSRTRNRWSRWNRWHRIGGWRPALLLEKNIKWKRIYSDFSACWLIAAVILRSRAACRSRTRYSKTWRVWNEANEGPGMMRCTRCSRTAQRRSSSRRSSTGRVERKPCARSKMSALSKGTRATPTTSVWVRCASEAVVGNGYCM